MKVFAALSLLTIGILNAPAARAFANQIDGSWVPRITAACETQASWQRQRGKTPADLNIPEFCDCIARNHASYARRLSANAEEARGHLQAILKIYTPLNDAEIAALQTQYESDDDIDQTYAEKCRAK